VPALLHRSSFNLSILELLNIQVPLINVSVEGEWGIVEIDSSFLEVSTTLHPIDIIGLGCA
jgi:hypothetical protein